MTPNVDFSRRGQILQNFSFTNFKTSKAFIFLSLLGLAYVLLINGAIFGFSMPTLGQAIWLGGYAESMANQFPSLKATDFGIPEPAAISFGLSGALVTSLLMALGINLADAYTMMCMMWFSVAYIGAYSLAKRFGLPPKSAIGMAVFWLILPVIWRHSGYSTLSLGLALLPFYANTLLWFLNINHRKLLKAVPFVILVYFISAFMDGYSYFMFVSFSAALMAFDWLIQKQNRFLHYSAIIACALLSFVTYSIYANATGFPQSSMNFTRGFGADLTFLIKPENGSHLVWDMFGLSKTRVSSNYFGDASVYWTSFSLSIFVVAIYFLFSRHGDRNLKLLFFFTGLIALYLSLGPTIKLNSIRPEGVSALMAPEYGIIPSGSEILYKYVPGLKSMRASYRWIALALMCYWAIIAIGLSSNIFTSRKRSLIILILLIFHTPNAFSRITETTNYRQQFFKLESDLSVDKVIFVEKEKVAFLPYGNDFLANHIWNLFDIQTFNIGGDKNLFLAKKHWPTELRHTGFSNFNTGDFDRSAKLLLNKEVDAVALSNIDLLSAAHLWPSPPVRDVQKTPIFEKFKKNEIFDIQNGKYFSTIRITPEAAMSGKTLKKAMSELCLSGLCIKNMMESTNVFTQVGSLNNGIMRSTGKRGFLFFGPYLPIQKGLYKLTVRGEAEQTAGAWLDIVGDKGQVKFFRTEEFNVEQNSGSLISAFVSIPQDIIDLEIRLYVTEASVVSVRDYTLIPE